MAWDYDGFSSFKPVKGNVVQADGNWHQVTFIAHLASAINNATATWKIEESPDGTNYTDVSSTVGAIFSTLASGTSTAFHCSTTSKAAYVRATLKNNGTDLGSGSTPVATYVALLGKPTTAPFNGTLVKGVEDGYASAPTN